MTDDDERVIIAPTKDHSRLNSYKKSLKEVPNALPLPHGDQHRESNGLSVKFAGQDVTTRMLWCTVWNQTFAWYPLGVIREGQCN